MRLLLALVERPRATAMALTSQTGLSRNTVLSTFEALLAEGYIVARTGSGTFVAHAAAAPPKGRGRRPATDVGRAASSPVRSPPEELSRRIQPVVRGTRAASASISAL